MPRGVKKKVDNAEEAVDENLNLVEGCNEEKIAVVLDSVRERCGIYLLPILLTLAGLLAGFSAIVASMSGDFLIAVIAIFIAMFMDFFDGHVARQTNTNTPFRTELDSLADIVSFGVAPALITFFRSLVYFPKLGFTTSFLYIASCALHLAHFNTKDDTKDEHYFEGLPIPAAAGLLVSTVWVSVGPALQASQLAIFATAFLTVLSSILMVSNIRYHSFKMLVFDGKTILLLLLIFAGVWVDPPKALFLLFFSYILSGPITSWIQTQK